MDVEYDKILAILKQRLGIMSDVRNDYLKSIIKGLVSEVERVQGIKIDFMDDSQIMFLVDYAEYRYSNRDYPTMPRHLQWRLHNLFIGRENHVE